MGEYRTALASDLREGDWRERSACAGLADRDLDPWHPDDDLPAADQRAAYDLAGEVCAGCPVREPCRAFGLAMLPVLGADGLGMYGGLTPRDLAALARAQGQPDRKVAQHGTRARRVAGCDCEPCKRAHAEYIAERRAAKQGPRMHTCGAAVRSGTALCPRRVAGHADRCAEHGGPVAAA